MKRELLINHTIFVASLMFFLLMLPGVSLADELVKGTMVMTETQGQDIEQIAVESVRDTLKACLGPNSIRLECRTALVGGTKLPTN